MDHFTVGIVCSGNTCRSPVAEAWFRRQLSIENIVGAQIWTAGLNVKGESDVPDEALRVAKEMGLSEDLIKDLKNHKPRDLNEESTPTDLLVWITAKENVNFTDGNLLPRAERICQKAKDLGATLVVIPQADDAWEAKHNGAPSDEVLELYREQAVNLRRWVFVLFRFVPKIQEFMNPRIES